MITIRLEIGMETLEPCCTAIVIQEYKSCLSQNSLSYWCYLTQYGIEVKVGKQTTEGRRIERGIKNNISLHQMERLILALILPYITPYQFEQIIRQTEQDAFTRGKNAVRKSLSDLLTEE